MRGVKPTAVSPNAPVSIKFNYKPAPFKMYLQQFPDEQGVNIPLKKGSFQAPSERGIYYYMVSAYWKKKEGSGGDTSAGFVIEVK
ncbi:hypothetical protein LRR81_09330 [Metabacillus sp. GX 13764]|uniref:hypothetical protein n=1 Tax=Metabacillus kandeliae TaxID=2900151 RepID=UPI001E603A59|nr:hypothetical protein [Metabacillus kandeliae]MCD7034438.1 hypothetical protein [Metabacillus kandeliae]